MSSEELEGGYSYYGSIKEVPGERKQLVLVSSPKADCADSVGGFRISPTAQPALMVELGRR